MKKVEFPFEVKYNHQYYRPHETIEILDKDLQNAIQNGGYEVEKKQITKKARRSKQQERESNSDTARET